MRALIQRYGWWLVPAAVFLVGMAMGSSSMRIALILSAVMAVGFVVLRPLDRRAQSGHPREQRIVLISGDSG